MIRKIIHINEEKCNGCGACARACHEGAIEMVNGKAQLIRDDYCDGFGDCLPECPTGAITFTEREAAPYDEAAVTLHKQRKQPEQHGHSHACPGHALRTFNRSGVVGVANAAGASDNAGFAYLLPETARLSDYGRSAQLFHQLMDLSLEERLYSQNMADYAVSLLMMELSQEYYISAQGAQRLPPAVASAREWIKNHCFRPFEMAELAAALGYSADYLSTLFKQCTGESVTRCANRLRISTAKTLLTNYGVTAKEAAYSCGFSDEKYFMKVFKQFEGLYAHAVQGIVREKERQLVKSAENPNTGFSAEAL